MNHTEGRVVLSEILDELPAHDPEAVRSRSDLRRINAVMGNYRWLARHMAAADSIRWLELGAGDGTLARHVPESRCTVSAVDLAPRPESWPPSWEWLSGDLFSLTLPAVDGVVANLFLHHFEEAALGALGRLLRSSGASEYFFSEPARRTLHHWQARLSHPLINRVTRHDMHVSIDAGFCGNELVELLGFAGEEWSSTVEETFWGAHRLSVSRRP